MTEIPILQNGAKKHHHHAWWHLVRITSLPYTTLFLLWAGLAVFFAFAYFTLEMVAPAHAPAQIEGMGMAQSFFNSLYYSIITATSTGYGDITPRGFSKALASMQSISALFVFAVFVTKLVSQRQELALQEVHKLTFEDIFHNTRGDLFIVRKDLDAVAEEAKKSGNLSDDSWDTLMIAYQQAQSLIAEIPDFYNGGNTYYTIDPKREQLLLEAVHRTFHRINKTLDTFSQIGIDWESHEPSMAELMELVNVIDRVTPLWQQRSPYQKMEAFTDIIKLSNDTRRWLEKSLPGN